MSRSYRTDPKWRIAARNAKRNGDDQVLLPRIVQRDARIGDVHPLTKHILAQMLSRLPVELYYGLRVIEMLPRQSEPGRPFAAYSRSSKTIQLYSLPLTVRFPSLSLRLRRLCSASQATIERQEDGFSVSWQDPFSMGFWFYHDVFVHELGHHHRFQYLCKTGRPGRRSMEEFLADCYFYWTTCGRMSPKKYQRKDERCGLPNNISSMQIGV